MGLHVSRRMAMLFFLAMYVAIKSFPLDFMPLSGFLSSIMSFDKPRQQQIWRTHKADESIAMDARLVAECPRALSPPPRINMTLRRGHLAQNLYNKYLKCGSPSLLNNTTRHMHPSMKNTPGVLDFTTFLSTNLKILVMGDSVAIQISQTLEEMLGGKPENRKIYRYSWGKTEGIHLSAPIRGGGVIAGWRLLGMLLRENVKRKLPNVGPGWRMEDVYNITHHTYNMSSMFGDYSYMNDRMPQQLDITRQVGSFDVLLFHIPIGWIKDYNSINHDTLMETVLLAGELFGVETVVFNVPSFTNNIMNAQQLQSLREVQHRVIQFSKDFVPPNKASINDSTTTTTVQHVLTLRMDRLMDETMEWNARLMGMIPNVTTAATSTITTNTTTTTTVRSVDENDDWRLVPLGLLPVRKGKTNFVHHVAQSCSALPSPENPNTCTPNHFSLDGMHVCMETMGGRLFAGLGCVLGCVYNINNNNNHPCQLQQASNKSSSTTALADYEKDVILNCTNACNDRYLSLTSVDHEVLDDKE